jgi:Flp pilus assembly protein TadG
MTRIVRFRRLLRALKTGEKGSVLIELALVVPALLVLVSGGFEITRYALLYQKINRIAVSMADLASQAKQISNTDIVGLFDAVTTIGQPFDMATNGEVIVTSVSLDADGDPTVNWQRNGGGAYMGASKIGSPGAAATLPAGFVVHEGDTVIIAEAFYDYAPVLFDDLLPPTIVYNVAYFRPRLGTLDTISGS